MPKPVSSFIDPERRRKKKKRRKRKVDYTELLKAPVIPEVQCPHTRRTQDRSNCSQCLAITPSVVHKPPTADWWAEDAVGELDIVIEIDIPDDI